MEFIQDAMDLYLPLAIHIIELIGSTIIIAGVIRATCNYTAGLLKKRKTDATVQLLNAMAIGLDFKMAGEILKTALVRDWQELIMLGCIILLRALLSFMIHTEMKRTEHH